MTVSDEMKVPSICHEVFLGHIPADLAVIEKRNESLPIALGCVTLAQTKVL